jgi:hypothetical protein
MEKEMRELYIEGVASHGGPESCVGVREGLFAPVRRRPHPGVPRQDGTPPAQPGGSRAANRTLYMIAIVRLRYCPRTRDYLARRTKGGKSNGRSFAASSATSPARSTTPSVPT